MVRRRAAVVALLVAAAGTLAGTVGLAVAPAAGASAMPPVVNVTTTTVPLKNRPDVPAPNMLLPPNYGHKPRDKYDRGGWVQTLVFLGILASGVIIAGLVFLESRRKLRAIHEAEAAAQAGRSSTRSEPVADTSTKEPSSTARQ